MIEKANLRPTLGETHAEDEFSILQGHIKAEDSFSLEENAPLGSFGYIANIENYLSFHPNGLASGFNVACVGRNTEGKPLFIGFDPDQEIFSEPRTYKEIQDFLHGALLEPLDERFFTEEELTQKQREQDLYRITKIFKRACNNYVSIFKFTIDV